MNETLAKLCAVYGILWKYKDGAGTPCEAPVDTCLAILQAMGVDVKTKAGQENHLALLAQCQAQRLLPDSHITIAGKPFQISTKPLAPLEWQITCEDGLVKTGQSTGPTLNFPALPMGRHVLLADGCSCLLICTPGEIPTPTRGWGIMVPLYGLSSDRNTAIGDYADLGQMADKFAENGASFIGINPIHAGFDAGQTTISPYSPSSRQMLNTLHIAIEHLPEWSEISDQLSPTVRLAEFVDYPAAQKTKSVTLKAAYQAFQRKPESSRFIAFIKEGGPALWRFALHQALSEEYGAFWNDWPRDFQNADSLQVRDFAKRNDDQIKFHCWLQWHANQQLRQAQTLAKRGGMEQGLYLDLAVGTHPFGAETWADPQSFAYAMSLGAPGDSFSASGQNWGLAPFNPNTLAANHYETFAQTLRSQLRNAGMLRIDHILGFEQAFWMPEGLPGAYVKMPREILLAITCIEAQRAGAVIIGEDLGNVPNGLRQVLASTGILGSRVAMFERDWAGDQSFTSSAEYTNQALASLTTHDLPTLQGWAQGRDIAWRFDLGELSQAQAEASKRERRKDVESFRQILPTIASQGSKTDAFALSAHMFLAQSSAILVAVQIEDVLGLIEQANLPGTVEVHPNWRRSLPLCLDEIFNLPLMREIAVIMKHAGRARDRGETGGKN